jgi:GWxTD domain-containing protein
LISYATLRNSGPARKLGGTGCKRSLVTVLVLAAALSVAACSASGPKRSLAELTNPSLGPELSLWLVGPVAHLATDQEIGSYLALRDDAQAKAFIEHFWAIRNPTPNRPDNPLQKLFEERCVQADHLFGESGYAGRRTDRGAIYVLYGKPKKMDYAVGPVENSPPLEVWEYAPNSAPGLDGQKPLSSYRFIKRGDVTVTYVPLPRDTRPSRFRPTTGPVNNPQ